MPDEKIDLFRAINTQRAIRSLRPDPVPDELITKIIDAATRAPSAGNSQPWAFVVVRDPELRAKLVPSAQKHFEVMYERALQRMKPGDPLPYQRLKLLIEKFGQVPAWIYPCIVSQPGSTPSSSSYGSIFPAIQNLLLAARGLGLGAALTMIALPAAKEVLGLPPEVEPVASIPLGYPDQEHYGRTTRKPLNEVIHWDRW